ncbi:hypothetical protein LFML04_1741 [Leptospirillum ferriphilum ML-04]|uniref:Uncharacterized protein n=1 Tax=Leptospirillum ferriphilum (strain ML-04) TaxID=1048260 RepID=J9ZDL7_LEPFM|nr:hypothetical protein LFML04_1741 [Leptospirillum ferriphilum ML-04]
MGRQAQPGVRTPGLAVVFSGPLDPGRFLHGLEREPLHDGQ